MTHQNQAGKTSLGILRVCLYFIGSESIASNAAMSAKYYFIKCLSFVCLIIRRTDASSAVLLIK